MFFGKSSLKSLWKLSEKLLHILIKLLNPQILFCKFQTNLKIQAIAAKSRIIFCKSKKIFYHFSDFVSILGLSLVGFRS